MRSALVDAVEPRRVAGAVGGVGGQVARLLDAELVRVRQLDGHGAGHAGAVAPGVAPQVQHVLADSLQHVHDGAISVGTDARRHGGVLHVEPAVVLAPDDRGRVECRRTLERLGTAVVLLVLRCHPHLDGALHTVIDDEGRVQGHFDGLAGERLGVVARPLREEVLRRGRGRHRGGGGDAERGAGGGGHGGCRRRRRCLGVRVGVVCRGLRGRARAVARLGNLHGHDDRENHKSQGEDQKSDGTPPGDAHALVASARGGRCRHDYRTSL